MHIFFKLLMPLDKRNLYIFNHFCFERHGEEKMVITHIKGLEKGKSEGMKKLDLQVWLLSQVYVLWETRVLLWNPLQYFSEKLPIFHLQYWKEWPLFAFTTRMEKYKIKKSTKEAFFHAVTELKSAYAERCVMRFCTTNEWQKYFNKFRADNEGFLWSNPFAWY